MFVGPANGASTIFLSRRSLASRAYIYPSFLPAGLPGYNVLGPGARIHHAPAHNPLSSPFVTMIDVSSCRPFCRRPRVARHFGTALSARSSILAPALFVALIARPGPARPAYL